MSSVHSNSTADKVKWLRWTVFLWVLISAFVAFYCKSFGNERTNSLSQDVGCVVRSNNRRPSSGWSRRRPFFSSALTGTMRYPAWNCFFNVSRPIFDSCTDRIAGRFVWGWFNLKYQASPQPASTCKAPKLASTIVWSEQPRTFSPASCKRGNSTRI
jgi:hypothetical protein